MSRPRSSPSVPPMAEHRAPSRLSRRLVAALAVAAVAGVAVVSATATTDPPTEPPQFAAPTVVVATTPQTATTRYTPDRAELREYLGVLQDRGLGLSDAEARTAVGLAERECARGGYIAGRQTEIRDGVRAALPRLDDQQTEIIVDCVVKATTPCVEGRWPA